MTDSEKLTWIMKRLERIERTLARLQDSGIITYEVPNYWSTGAPTATATTMTSFEQDSTMDSEEAGGDPIDKVDD